MKHLPAIAGGQPIRAELLPFAKPTLDAADINAVSEVLKSGILVDGPRTEEFESAFAEYTGAKYAVAVSSGSAGLHIALRASAVGHQEEVLTSPLSFPINANCILYQQGIHTFVDVDPSTYNIDISTLRQKITMRSKAIIPVHFAGQPCDLDPIYKLAEERNLVVIEDATQALGAKYKGKKIGSMDNMTVFGFDATQNLTTGEGGMVTTNSEENYKWLKIFRNLGLVRDPDLLVSPEGPWHYEMQDLGFNYRLTEIQASLGLTQLAKVDDFLKRRKEIACLYNEAFTQLHSIILPFQMPDVESSWHHYIIRLQPDLLTADRLQIYLALRAENIAVDVNYLPIFLHPYYKWLGHPDICTLEGSLCPQAEEIYKNIISLPIYPAMTEQDINDVITAVKKVITYYSK
ncbi:DegT/DnrJ/EryC1/StrS family aminotransferase [Desulfolucanica intricata]|uniref:DegT/DnrJ/EryC1/StrS family aminotransferase n=1 Tax=Desulfolucanica intricata TaxID=1285191 RepID=UPI00082B9B91|nr:DegT/DnrJ/EryC1/StrS aminotransferase family protein [Desulfolucanica intricata]